MKIKESYYPREANLGSDCMFWVMGCTFPKFEMQGRTSCEGIIDPVCIYLKESRRVDGLDLDDEQIQILKTKLRGDAHSIPPGKPFRIEE